MLGITRGIFTLVAVACLLFFAWDGRQSLSETVSSGAPLQLLMAVLMWSLMHFLAPLLSAVTFRARGYHVSYRTAADVHIANLPARYIPGGVWHTVGRIAGFKRLGIGKLDIAIFVFLENVLAVGLAFVLGGSIVAFYHDAQGWGLLAACAAIGGLVLLLASPFILSRRFVAGNVRFALFDYLACVGVVALSWIVAAAAFVLYTTAFTGLDLRTSPLETGGAYLFAWGTGFVSVFAPQGIGVFEVVAGELMRGGASLKSVAALLVGFRLVILVADGFTWGVRQALSGIGARSKTTV